MQNQQTGFLGRLVPFIGMGIFIVLIIVGLIFLSYLIVIGALIGFVLFVLAYLKNRFFPNKYPTTKSQQSEDQSHHGKTYDHDEFK